MTTTPLGTGVMLRLKERELLRSDKITRLVEAASDASMISGLTHNFYRYPARFSPRFVRAAIEAFTEPGDLVLDPFVGGGTTLVESLALGRTAVGADISSLATFVSEVKTTIYTEDELTALEVWARTLSEKVDLFAPAETNAYYEEAGYLRHLDNPKTWRSRKAIDQVLSTTKNLGSVRLESFARCVVLRTAQWALDGRRKKVPSVANFRDMLSIDAKTMIEGARELRNAVFKGGRQPSPVYCLHRTTDGLETDQLFASGAKPQLVVTSPPYPGVHVLYHRWQVDGRKETPAPFWIANRLDGDGAAYYTMGARSPLLNTYFSKLRAALKSVAAVCDSTTMVIQVVAFSEPSWQLPRYLSVADDVGLSECYLPHTAVQPDGRLWRTVPNRKWYAGQRGETSGSQEVVLFHRRRS